MGKIDFGGILKEVSLAYLPEAQIGDYVIVHVGFAISRVDEAEAMQVFAYLREMEELVELEDAANAADSMSGGDTEPREPGEAGQGRVALQSPPQSTQPVR